MNKKNTSEYLSHDFLTKNNFKLVRENVFENLQMPYYANNSVLLFFNEPVTEWNEKDFLIGYGNMYGGKYYAVTFKWIDKKEQLNKIFEAITNNSLI